MDVDSTGQGLAAPAEDAGGVQHETVVHAMRHWCREQPHKVLYTWLDANGEVESQLTYRELEMRADAVAHALLTEWKCKPGDRAVLMYLPGLDYIAAHPHTSTQAHKPTSPQAHKHTSTQLLSNTTV